MAALIHDPQVVILDEPFTGLDYVNLEKTQDFLLKLAAQGKCILLSSHQYDELDAICNSLLILHEGKTMAYGNLDRMKNDEGKCTIKVNAQVSVLQLLRDDEAMEMTGNAVVIKTQTPQRAKRLMNLLSRDDFVSDLSMERIKVKELIRLRCLK
jgi:ABC-2 type transport system ATP-binding protein